MRKQIAAANWKMNLTWAKAEILLNELINNDTSLSNQQEVILAVPFPYLIPTKEKLVGKKNMYVAAQNCHYKDAGAYTGETSAQMLQSIEVTHIIIGHSERREYFSETNSMLAEKVNQCLTHSLKPIFCCGEPLAIRESGTENHYVETQLKESLFHLTAEQLTGFIIAYEPIWAIGTGKTASNDQAQQMHAHIRKIIARQYGDEVANSISILYGGSVKGSNAKEIFGQPDVDGGLVGGASLVVAEFTQIIKSLK